MVYREKRTKPRWKRKRCKMPGRIPKKKGASALLDPYRDHSPAVRCTHVPQSSVRTRGSIKCTRVCHHCRGQLPSERQLREDRANPRGQTLQGRAARGRTGKCQARMGLYFHQRFSSWGWDGVGGGWEWLTQLYILTSLTLFYLLTSILGCHLHPVSAHASLEVSWETISGSATTWLRNLEHDNSNRCLLFQIMKVVIVLYISKI